MFLFKMTSSLRDDSRRTRNSSASIGGLSALTAYHRRLFVEPPEDRNLLSVFTVNTTGDRIDANPGDGIAADAFGNTSLRAAIMEANALAGFDSINLQAGTYTLGILGIDEDSAATGDLDIKDDLIIDGGGPAITIINGAGLDRVFQVMTGVSLDLFGMSIANGKANYGGVFTLFRQAR